jgi:U3 small nucleolar RNA-associated protein 13
MKEIFAGFSQPQMETFLSYVRDWNTNAKHSSVAQRVLKQLFSQFAPSFFEQIPTIKSLMEGIIPYTERHFQRLDRLLQRSFLLDYTLQRMEAHKEVVYDEEDTNDR